MADTYAADRLVAAGLEHHNAGRLDEAAERYGRALEADPKHGDALHLLGVTSHMRGEHGTARELIQRAINSNRKQPEYYANLGRVLMELGQPSKAVEACKKALRLQPDFTPFRVSLGKTLVDAGRAVEAVRVFKQVREADEANPMAALGLAIALREAGDFEASLETFDEVLRLDSTLAKAHVDKGNILSSLGRHAEALAAYDAAIAADPDMVEAHANKGAILAELGDAEASAVSHAIARRIEPELTRSVWAERLALPIVYESSDQIEEARSRWGRGLDSLDAELRLETQDQIGHALLAVRSTPPFLLHYQGRRDIALMRRWADLVRRVVEAACPHLCDPVSRRTQARKRLRVGFASSFFCHHSIFKTHGAWIRELDRSRFETYVFHTGSRMDDATQIIKRASEKFFHMPGAGIADAERIKGCDLDVLIHTDIGMDPISQFLATLNLAPVQANGLGRPVTSGMATIDHALTSDLIEPADGDADYSEELVRLANLASCFADAGISAAPPQGATSDGPTYLCASGLYKLLPEDDAVFADLAKRTGSCRIQFIRHTSDHVNGVFERRLARAFEARGLDAADHCVMLDRMDQQTFYRTCGHADVLLDSFAWSGNSSTLEGLATGTPAVTLPGETMRSRQSAAILRRAGLEDLIAEDREGYVDIAHKAACDAPWRSGLQERLHANRARCYNDTAPVRDLESYLDRVCGRV